MNPREPLLNLRDESLLRLRFAGGLRSVEQLHLVRQMRERHRREVDQLRIHLAGERADGSFRQLTIEFAMDWNRWACEWCAAL